MRESRKHLALSAEPGGTNREVSLAGTWRGGGHVVLVGELTRSAVRLPAGRFIAIQASGRVEYAFNTRTDLYVVWNSGYTSDPDSDERFPRVRGLRRPLNGALVVKAVRRFAPR